MSIKKLNIEGLRGFSKNVEIEFAMPDGKNYGSGLTVLVGPNNSGKSTVIEAVHLLSVSTDVIPISARNILNDSMVRIEATDNIGHTYSLQSTSNKGAFVERKYDNNIQESWDNKLKTFILTSKRNFSSTFGNNSYQTRENYSGNIGNSEYRNENNINNNFGGRLLTIYNNKSAFEECLKKVVNPMPNWTIESMGNNNLYLEFSFNEVRHSSNGAGDGYINIFNIVDSLYDSAEDNVILIDEPEISLHPDLQRKLFKLLVEYSKDKQIIISTHSPYFVDWELFSKYSKIVRFRKENDCIKKYELSLQTKSGIGNLIYDSHHPHILSLNANEIFFLNDNIILTEGQDDVLCYRKIFEQFDFEPNASFFGWGAGGANKIEFVLNILKDLGYKKVFIILDNDKKDMIDTLSESYFNYQSYAISTHDVRDKERDRRAKKVIKTVQTMELDEDARTKIITLLETNFPEIEGIITSMKNYNINQKYNDDILSLISEIKKYFSKEEIDQESLKKDSISDFVDNHYKEDDKIKAHRLLDKYLSERQLHKYIKSKYNYLEFRGGGGGILSFNKIKDNIYYVVMEQGESISKNHEILIQFHFTINTKKEIIKLKKRKIVKNTLPKKYKI